MLCVSVTVAVAVCVSVRMCVCVRVCVCERTILVVLVEVVGRVLALHRGAPSPDVPVDRQRRTHLSSQFSIYLQRSPNRPLQTNPAARRADPWISLIESRQSASRDSSMRGGRGRDIFGTQTILKD